MENLKINGRTIGKGALAYVIAEMSGNHNGDIRRGLEIVEAAAKAGVDAIKLRINDELIRKVAESFACLEAIKELPQIIYDPKNPSVQRETAAGRAWTKFMAQYQSAMQKLNKELLGGLNGDDGDDLGEYDDDND